MNTMKSKSAEDSLYEFLFKTKSEVIVQLNGLSDRFNSGHKTLEYTFVLKRGDREYKALYNSSLNDLCKLLKFNEKKINYNCLFAERIIDCLEANIDKQTIKIWEGNYRIRITREFIPKPSSYDIVTCLHTYEVNSLDDFMNEYGYEISDVKSYKNIKKIYKQCKKEYTALQTLYNPEELEQLVEIINS